MFSQNLLMIFSYLVSHFVSLVRQKHLRVYRLVLMMLLQEFFHERGNLSLVKGVSKLSGSLAYPQVKVGIIVILRCITICDWTHCFQAIRVNPPEKFPT